MNRKVLIGFGLVILFLLATKKVFPRGIRNNNPGNIKENGTPWKGRIKPADQVEPMKDDVFVVFSSMRYGLRAMARALLNRMNRGENSIRQLVTAWAPPTENLTNEYVNAVSARTGIAPDAPLKREDTPRLMEAMILHENGDPSPGIWVTMSQLIQAVNDSGV